MPGGTDTADSVWCLADVEIFLSWTVWVLCLQIEGLQNHSHHYCQKHPTDKKLIDHLLKLEYFCNVLQKFIDSTEMILLQPKVMELSTK